MGKNLNKGIYIFFIMCYIENTYQTHRSKNMESTENKTDFESCKNMIYKLALTAYRTHSSRKDVQFDDVHSEAMLIYAMCLKNYDASKGMKFTTYLYTNLKGRLNDFYRCTMKPIEHYEDMNDYDSRRHVEIRYEDNIIENERKNDWSIF